MCGGERGRGSWGEVRGGEVMTRDVPPCVIMVKVHGWWFGHGRSLGSRRLGVMDVSTHTISSPTFMIKLRKLGNYNLNIQASR